MKQYFPLLKSFKNYKKEYFSGDVIAGITVGVLLIPQGMAYAMLAGLPPVFGLYAALVPQVVYAFMGTSRQLSVGPVAMDSLLVATSLAGLRIVGVENYIAVAIFLSLFVGGIQLGLGLLRMGFVVNFLSKPVISGFTSAAAIMIAFSQIKNITGVAIADKNELYSLFQNINLLSLFVGVVSIVFIVLLKKHLPKIPSALLLVVIGVVTTFFLKLDVYGLKIIGDIPNGLPSLKFPNFETIPYVKLIPIAFTLALIGFMEAVSISKSLEDKVEEYEVDANQELVAIGASNIVGAFFQTYPVTGGFSRTAVNNQSGAKTGFSSIIAAIVVAITLLFLTPLFYYLPIAVLGAMIVVAVFNLIDFKQPLVLWKQSKDEFFLLILTFLITLFVGVVYGISIGILASLLVTIYRTSTPHIAVLARVKGSSYFKNINRFKDTVNEREDLLIVRFDAQLFYGNKDYFKNKLEGFIKRRNSLKAIVLNAESISYIDSSANSMLIKFIKKMKGQGIQFYVAGAIGPARDTIFTSGIIEVLGKENLFVRTNEAVDCFDGVICKDDLQNTICQQVTKGSL